MLAEGSCSKASAPPPGCTHRPLPSAPAIRLEEDKLFVVDGQIWTSAGMSARVDLALAMKVSDPQGRRPRPPHRAQAGDCQRRGSEQSQLSALRGTRPQVRPYAVGLAYAREN